MLKIDFCKLERGACKRVVSEILLDAEEKMGNETDLQYKASLILFWHLFDVRCMFKQQENVENQMIALGVE